MIATKGIVQKVVRQALSPNRMLIDRIEEMDRTDPARWERVRSAVGRWVEGLLWGYWKEDRDFLSWEEVLDLPEFRNLPQRRIYGVPTFKVQVEPNGKGRIWAQVLIFHKTPQG